MYRPTGTDTIGKHQSTTRELIGLVNTAFQSGLSAKRKLI